MSDDENHPLILLPDASLEESTAGADRVLSAMIVESLALLRQKQTSIEPHWLKIGDHEFCEPDYRQILRWAAALELEPGVFIGRLLSDESMHGEGSFIHEPLLECAGTKIEGGGLIGIHWDLDQLPISRIASEEILRTKILSIGGKKKRGMLSLDLSHFPYLTGLQCNDSAISQFDLCSVHNLTTLDCSWTGITELDLSPVPNLIWLDCHGTPLTVLNLSPVPNLTTLGCSLMTRITELDLSHVRNLTSLECCHLGLAELDLTHVPRLTSLECSGTNLVELDLSLVPGLTSLGCGWTEISNLDLSVVPSLKELDCRFTEIVELDIRPLAHLCKLSYDTEKTRLIQRPEQNF